MPWFRRCLDKEGILNSNNYSRRVEWLCGESGRRSLSWEVFKPKTYWDLPCDWLSDNPLWLDSTEFRNHSHSHRVEWLCGESDRRS